MNFPSEIKQLIIQYIQDDVIIGYKYNNLTYNPCYNLFCNKNCTFQKYYKKYNNVFVANCLTYLNIFVKRYVLFGFICFILFLSTIYDYIIGNTLTNKAMLDLIIYVFCTKKYINYQEQYCLESYNYWKRNISISWRTNILKKSN